MRMILAALSERAAAESKKCCVMMTHRRNRAGTLLPGSAEKLYPQFIGGGSYIKAVLGGLPMSNSAQNGRSSLNVSA